MSAGRPECISGRHLRRHDRPRHTFNSTLTALTLALLMMFLLHQLQHIQDRAVLDTKNLIDQRLIARLRLG